MLHATYPRVPIRSARAAAKSSSVTVPQAAPATRDESLAAPITLAIVVGATPLVAGAAALVTALGG